MHTTLYSDILRREECARHYMPIYYGQTNCARTYCAHYSRRILRTDGPEHSRPQATVLLSQ